MRAGVASMPAAREAREGLVARLRDLDAAHRERIDHHDGAAGGGGQHRDARRPRADRRGSACGAPAASPRAGLRGFRRARCRNRRGTRSRHRPRRRARRCASRRARAPPRSGRACSRRPACRAPRRRARTRAARRRCGWFRGTGGSCRCRDHRASTGRSRRPRGRPRCRPRRARQSRRPLALPRDISAPIIVPECEATKVRPTGMSGSANAALAVSITPSRRLMTPRLDGPTMRMPVSAATSRRRCSRATPSAPVSEKPAARMRGDLHAGLAAFGDGVDHDVGSAPRGRRGPAPRAARRPISRRARPSRCRGAGSPDRSCRDSPPGAGISAAGRWSCRRRPTAR